MSTTQPVSEREVPGQIDFPEQLPVSERRADIEAAIRDHQVVILAGETGSGKTTQLPKICLNLGRGRQLRIGHTQPRRIAARTVAQRIADELNTSLGGLVGYQIRFNDTVSDASAIKLMTDGILLAALMAPFGIIRRLFLWGIGRLPGRISARLNAFMQEWTAMADWFWSRLARAAGTVLFSLAIWGGHLFQFWLFTKAVRATVPLIDNMAFATLSILAGLLPLTMAGIGSRDAAIIHFYGPWLSPAAGAAVGVLATSRYLLPAIAGAPFMRDYWQHRKKATL